MSKELKNAGILTFVLTVGLLLGKYLPNLLATFLIAGVPITWFVGFAFDQDKKDVESRQA